MKICAIDLETMPIGAYPNQFPKPIYAGFVLNFEFNGSSKVENENLWYIAVNLIDDYKSGAYVVRQILDQLITFNTIFTFYNAEYDLNVLKNHVLCGHIEKDEIKYICTQIMQFLLDPYSNHSLKNDCEYYDIAVDEKTEIIDWIVDNAQEAKRSKRNAGAYIYKAPAKMIEQRVLADALLTYKLFQKQRQHHDFEQCLKPYKTMAKAATICTNLTEVGINIDFDLLNEYKIKCIGIIAKLDDSLYNNYGCDKTAGNEFIEYLKSNFDTTNAVFTDKSDKISTSVDALAQWINDKTFVKIIYLKSTIEYVLSVFINGFENSMYAGKVHARWYHVKNYEEQKSTGTATGRLSSSPNMQNVITDEKFTTKWSLLFGESPPKTIIDQIPNIRKLIIPESGNILVSFDYSQQELRIFAEYIYLYTGIRTLKDKYANDKAFDMHAFSGELIRPTLEYVGICSDFRKIAKTVSFLILYGGGAKLLAKKLNCDYATAYKIREAYINELPGFANMLDVIKIKSSLNQPLITLGGRLYYEKPAKYIDGSLVTYTYLRLNHLIQPSAADILKNALVMLVERVNDIKIVSTIHDQILLELPYDNLKVFNKSIHNIKSILIDASFGLKIPVDCAIGKNYGELVSYNA